MPNGASRNELSIPVYGIFTVYPGGSRDEAAQQHHDAPCVATVRPGDWFGFTIGAVADVRDDDLVQLADSLAGAPNLRDLNIGGCEQVGDRGLNAVARFDQLEDLCMNSVRGVSRRGLAVLGRLPRLVNLNLEWVNNVDDSTAETVSRLTRLEQLDFNQCPGITDAGLEHISRLSGLKGLGINAAQVMDRGIESVVKLRRLTGLMLPTSNGRVTDRGLALLAELPDLNYLSLANCTGFLGRLLRGGISRAGLARFRQAKPECDIWSPEIGQEFQRMIDAASDSE